MIINFEKILFYIFLNIIFFYNIVSAETFDEESTFEMMFGEDEIVSIATGNKQLIYKTPAIANVITQQDIKDSSAITLNQVLETVPGLHVSENYFSGDAIYNMRGFFRDPDAGILILVNGIPVNTFQTGARVAALQMPVASIDRIEIIRGPGSAIYGANAFVGTINIITISPSNTKGLNFGIRASNNNQQNYWLQDAFNFQKWELGYTLEWLSSEDNSRQINRDLQTFFDDTTGTNASTVPGTMDSGYKSINFMLDARYNHWQLRQWIWSNLDQGNEHGTPGLDVIDNTGQTESGVSLSSIEYINPEFTDNWSLNSRFSFMLTNEKRLQYLLPANSIAPVGTDGNLFTPGISTRQVNFPGGMINQTKAREEHFQFEVSTVYSGLDSHQIRFASGLQYQSFDATQQRNFGPGVLDQGQTSASTTLTDVSNSQDIYLPDSTRDIVYLSLQDEWDFSSDWTLTSGLRYDKYSDFGDTLNPRMALVWQTRYNLTSKLLYGQAFRAPTGKELYIQNSPGTEGNSQLNSESINTLELSFDYRPSLNIQSVLSFFAYQAKDLITPVDFTGSANTKSYENSELQEGHGVEIEFNWQITRQLDMESNYSWQFSRLNNSDIELANAPAHQIYAKLNWEMFPKLNWINEVYWLQSGARAIDDNREVANNVLRLDSRLRYSNYFQNWEFSIIARNLLDRENTQPSSGNDSIPVFSAALPGDVPMRGRSIFFEFRKYTDI